MAIGASRPRSPCGTRGPVCDNDSANLHGSEPRRARDGLGFDCRQTTFTASLSPPVVLHCMTGSAAPTAGKQSPPAFPRLIAPAAIQLRNASFAGSRCRSAPNMQRSPSKPRRHRRQLHSERRPPAAAQSPLAVQCDTAPTIAPTEFSAWLTASGRRPPQ